MYDLSTKAFSFVGVTDIRILPHTGKEFKHLINKKFDNYFYDNLIAEINGTYFSGLFTSTMILCRKLFENRLYDLLKKKYPAEIDGNLDLYYDMFRNKPKDFDELINVLLSREKDFGDEKKTIDRLVSKIKSLKRDSNDNTHTLTVIASQNDITKHDMQEILELFIHLDEVIP